jgi:inner membrane protein
MPTVFSHAAASAALGRVYARDARDWEFWALSALCSALPDADVAGIPLGVRNGTLFAHRGITHSLLFAALVGACAAWWYSRKTSRSFDSLWLYFAAVTASHGFLDAFTSGGRGIAFLAPFDGRRFFFPWRPIVVSPIGAGFFSSPRLWAVVRSELVWVWLPSAAVFLLASLAARVAASDRR